jgi:hypothetical protein
LRSAVADPPIDATKRGFATQTRSAVSGRVDLAVRLAGLDQQLHGPDLNQEVIIVLLGPNEVLAMELQYSIGMIREGEGRLIIRVV